ncbi:uncharacterized protein LOC132388361 [Hypanus sabinus]|uniref:uncharacterized protein LOC132388361 n=1 Tax=Hypanus sabinus TaxID=79690 RepID=UPI0028C3F92A|nr:uncharacterized protein LOC132388361 [Hypanus sabinus]
MPEKRVECSSCRIRDGRETCSVSDNFASDNCLRMQIQSRGFMELEPGRDLADPVLSNVKWKGEQAKFCTGCLTLFDSKVASGLLYNMSSGKYAAHQLVTNTTHHLRDTHTIRDHRKAERLRIAAHLVFHGVCRTPLSKQVSFDNGYFSFLSSEAQRILDRMDDSETYVNIKFTKTDSETPSRAAPERESKVKIGNRPYRQICLFCLVTSALIVIVAGLSIHVSQVSHKFTEMETKYRSVNETKAQICELLTSRRVWTGHDYAST